MSGAVQRGWSRRQFLARSGWLAGGVTVFSSCRLMPVMPTFDDPTPEGGLAWVQMRADGTVTFLCPRAEMGQGIATGLTQVVAEELGLANGDIRCVYARTDQIEPVVMTVGSQSIEQFFTPTALAAAGLREHLQRRAAARRGVGFEDLVLVEGGFAPRGGGAGVAFAELIEAGEETVAPVASAQAPVLLSRRSASERRAVGRVREPVHIDRLVTGAEVYSRDVQRPGLAFGEVAHPPQLGAERTGANPEAARAVAGVIAVVEGPDDQIGVVAETPMAARRGLEALACTWRELDPEQLAEVQTPLDIDRAAAEGVLDHTPVDDGDVERGRAAAARELDVRYDTPMVAHACMEPRSGVAELRDGRCEVWTGSQDPWFVQGHVARAVGLSKSDVVVHNQRIGGAFGGRALCQASVEAAWLAAGSGRPVKVQWSREDEFAHNYVGPQYSHRIRAGVDADGEIAWWHHQMVGSPILTSSAMVPGYLHWAADLIADPGTWRGAQLPYRVASQRVEFADVRKPMPTGPWRGLGAAPNTFAVECAVDELAGLADRDPLAFRLQRATEPRYRHVLERLRALCEWDRARPDGTQLGVAGTVYKGVTFVAVAAQIEAADGEPRVTGLWCVQDCGLVVCPDQVSAQIEGNLVWGVSMALREAFALENGIAATRNFDRYALARNDDVPAIAVEMVASEAPPSGSGEAAFAPAAAAIVNAVSRARGQRLRTLPLGKPA